MHVSSMERLMILSRIRTPLLQLWLSLNCVTTLSNNIYATIGLLCLICEEAEEKAWLSTVEEPSLVAPKS